MSKRYLDTRYYAYNLVSVTQVTKKVYSKHWPHYHILEITPMNIYTI